MPQASKELRDRWEIARCPLCDSAQVAVCLDANNEAKALARCRECKCTAPLAAWNGPRNMQPAPPRECNQDLMFQGNAHPPECAICGDGRCPRYPRG